MMRGHCHPKPLCGHLIKACVDRSALAQPPDRTFIAPRMPAELACPGFRACARSSPTGS